MIKLFNMKRAPPTSATPIAVGSRKTALMMQLEPRIMFDGAAVATAIDVAHHEVGFSKEMPMAEKPAVTPRVAAIDIPKVADRPVVNIDATNHEIVFVDTSVQDYRSLLTNINPNTEVVLINSQQDGLKVIADTVAGRSDIDAIYIVSHGEAGKIQLGNAWIDSAYLASHQQLLATIGKSMTDDGDILLYGCNVGSGTAGQVFVQSVAKLTNADVAASTDNTGSAQLGGNWVLEYKTGDIEAHPFTSSSVLAHYDALLAAPTSENFDGVAVSGGYSLGTVGAARVIDGWTFSILNGSGSLDSTGAVDVTNVSSDTTLANDGGDHAALLQANYGGGTGTQAAGVMKATTGEEFSFTSIRVENGFSASANYRLVGYKDGVAVSGATQDFVAAAYGTGGNTVTVSGNQWKDVDEVRIVQQSGSVDISIYVDDIVVSPAVTNAAPVVTTTGGTTNYEAGASATTVDSGVTVTDSDNSTQASGTVSIGTGFHSGDTLAFTNTSATLYGNITASYNSGTGVMTLTSSGATATDAQWANALDAATFSSTSTTYGNRTVSFVTNDGTDSSTAATKTVHLTAPPIVSTDSGSASFVAGDNTASTPVTIDSGLTVTDGSTLTLASATVSITTNFHSGEDVLSFTNDGSTMGNIVSSYNATTGVLTLTSAGDTASIAQWQASLDAVKYTDTAVTPNSATRTISFSVTDSNSITSSTQTRNVTVSDTDQTPIVTTTGGTTLNYVGGASAAAIDNGISVSDLDNSSQFSGTVSISSGFHSGDTLSFINTSATLYGNITASYNSGTGVMTMSSAGATATDAQWANAFSAAAFSAGIGVTPGNRTISFVTNDGTKSSTAATDTVNATAPNNTPTITNLSGDSVAWAGIGNTVVLDASSNAVLNDAEFAALNGGNGDWAGGSLSLQRSGTAISSDVLGFNTSGALFTVSGSNLQSGGLTFATFTNTGGVLTINFTSSGTAATTALVNDIAQRINYRNDTPADDATLRFTLSDGNTSTTADVTVASDTIYVTNATDTATIDLTNGVSFSEAIGIAAADVTGSQTIVFASSLASTALTVNSVTLNESLIFDMDAASGMSLTGGSITIGSGTTLTLSDGTGHTAAVSSVINGSSGALTKAGAGTVTLSNTNSYTGVTTVSAGTLAVSVANAISTGSSVSVSSGAIWSLSALQSVGNLSGAGSINLGSSTLSTRVTADSTFSGGISGTGPLNINQTGAATFALTLSGTNTFTGATTLQNFAWLKLDGDAAYSNSSALRVNGNSKLTLLSDQTVGSIASNAGTASLNLGSFTLSAGGDNTNTSVTGVISGTGAVTKQGSGTLTLSGTNTYTGLTSVSAGTLSLNGGAAIVDTNAVTIASGATLNISASETIGSLSGAGSVTLGANTLTTGGDNTSTSFSGGISGSGGALTKTGSGTFTLSGTNSYTGATLVSGGTLSVASDSNLGAGTLTLATGTTLALTGAANVDNAIAFSGNATVNTSANATLSGNITGAGGLTKTGSSSLTLSGTDSFTGATNVSAGALIVNGALSGTSGMTVASSGTLGGTGSIFASSSTNTLTVQSGGTLSPGNGAAGTITVNGNLVMAAGSTLAVDINSATAGTGYDQVMVNGTIDVSGATLATTHGYTAASGDTYAILVNDAADGITGNFSGLSEGGTLTAGGDSVQLTGSYIGGTGNDFTLTAPVFPSVTSVSTVTPDGTYKIGDTITVAVNFSEVVYLSTGTIQLTLETGAVDRTVSYLAGSGTSTLYFNYTVQTGDQSLDLDYASTTALNANGDTIQSGSFNNAILTLPTPGASGSLGAGAALVIDGVRPTASLVVADNSLTIGETSLMTITFSEAVTGFTTADLTVANGAVSGLSTSDGGITWTATLTPTTNITDTTNVVTLDNTGVQDIAGNAGSGTTNSNNYAIDNVRPTASIVVADNSLTVGETSLVTVTFSEAVTGFTTADLTVANGAVSSLSTSDGGITWTATLTPTASITDATNVITLDNTGIQDLAGNAGTGTTDSNNYAIDNIRPTASIVVADNSLAVGETSAVTITFSEAVTGFTTADLSVANGTVSGLSTSDGGITWTATLTPTASTTDATNVITLDNTGVQDLVGNAGTGTTDSNNYAIDTQRPTASIVVSDTSLSIGETSAVTVTFSEAVTGFTTADLTVANGAVSGLSTSDGGITWTATLTPTTNITDTTNVVTLDNTGVQDIAGNAGSGTTNSNNYAIDNVRPTASIVVADNSLTVGETSLVTVTFSEAVTGFTTADLTVANGAVSSLSTSDGGITWTATLTPTANITDATNVITLDNTGVQDLAGNAGTGTTNSNNYAIDTQRPTASIVVSDTSLAIGETSNVTFTFSEAVTGFTTADLSVANGAVSGLSTSDGGITWTATLTPTANITDATNVITLDNTGVQDLAGNAGSGTTNSNNYAIDTQRPTASIVVSDTSLSIGETSAVTVTFSEAVTGFTTADLSVANGAVSSLSTSDGGITWTATLIPTASTTDATNVITLDNTGVQDIAGNAGSGTTDSNNYAIDTLRPTASIVVSDTSLSIGDTSAVTVTFSEAVTGLTTADLTVANGAVSGLSTSDGGITWTATLTPTANITDATNVITLDNTGIQDLAGNAGTGTPDSNNYAIDTQRPTASIAVANTSLASGDTSNVTFTFSEAVTGFTTADLTVANGTVSGLSTADGGITWTATLTPTASVTDGTNVITLDNTGVQDAASNTGTGSIDSNNYAIDTLAPTVSSVTVPTNGTYVSGQNLDFTVNTSEAVTVDTGGGTPRIAVTLDTGGTIFANYISGSGTSVLTFRATVATGEMDSNGIAIGASLDANGGTVRDAVGNDAVLTLNSVASTTNVLVDSIAPSVASVDVPAAGHYNAGDMLTFTVNSSENVIVDTGGGTPQLSISIGGTNHVANYVSGSGSNALLFQYTVQAGDNGTGIAIGSTLASNGATLRDAAGNALNIGLNNVGASTGVIIDNVAPTASSLVRADFSPTNADTVHYTLNFSEDVTGLSIADLSLATTGNVDAQIAGITQMDAHTYTITLIGVKGNGSLRVNLADAAGITDLAGNALTAGTTGDAYQVITTLPDILPQHESPNLPVPDHGYRNPGSYGFTEPSPPFAMGSFTLPPLVTELSSLPVVHSIDVSKDPSFDIPLPWRPMNLATGWSMIELRNADGSAVPTWLHYDVITGTLQGVPPANFSGALQLEIVMTDSRGPHVLGIVELHFSAGNASQADNAIAPHEKHHSAKSSLDAQFARHASRTASALTGMHPLSNKSTSTSASIASLSSRV